MIRFAQPGSAIFSELSPRPQDANLIELLRAIEHGVRVLDWRTARGRVHEYPERIPLSWDPKPEGAIQGDSMDWDDAAAFLGWEAEMARFFTD